MTEVFSARSVPDEEAPPVPVSATDSGLFDALLVTVSVPVAEPEAVGVNVTETVQLAPAARVLPQVLVCANGPVVATAEMSAVAPPPLVTVVVCAALVEPTVVLPNVSSAGDADSDGVAGVVPVPVSETVSGLFDALLVTVRVPVWVPDAVAPYSTEKVQFAPAARLLPQVLVCENGPVVAIDEIAAAALPELVTVTV